MTVVAEKLSMGDIDQKVNIDRRDEVGDLARSLAN